MVVWEPGTEWTRSAAEQEAASGFCRMEGAKICGRAEQVYLRGELVAENGKILKEKTGRYIRHGAGQHVW